MTLPKSDRWQFWIDVGGTFTDAFARSPQGELLREKVLSSGVTKGKAGESSTMDLVEDAVRLGEPDGFWNGARMTLLDAQGAAAESSIVKAFDGSSGKLQLSDHLTQSPAAGQSYELTTGEEAPLLAIRRLLRLPLSEPIPAVNVRLGATRGTNALLTRTGARTALAVTRGFADVLLIGGQNRPRLFDLAIVKPSPLFSSVVEIDERIAADGATLVSPNREEIRQQLRSLRDHGVDSLAICLLHAYKRSDHEDLVATIAQEVGFEEISVSSRVAPLRKMVLRGDTTVVDAYLNPVLRSYVASLSRSLGDTSELRLLTSAGGLVHPQHYFGKDSVLSGPAGGVVGFSQTARAAGFERSIGFDMGGTSTDVSRFDGRYDLEYETEKAGVRITAPMMAIETVAAGGGSVCRFDGVKLAVGPQSAGADPGPACYGRGGPLCVTDVNLYLGRIFADRFPFSLNHEAVRSRLKMISQQIQSRTGNVLDIDEVAEGFLQIANANMASAIRSVSIAKGCDPANYALVAFGGAAGQHACEVARQLEMTQILIHPDASVLSALGMGMANVVRHRAHGVYKRLTSDALRELEPLLDELTQQAREEVVAEGVEENQIDMVHSLELRYEGVEASLNILRPDDGDFAKRFAEEHYRLYGWTQDDRPLEIVAARVEVIGRSSFEAPPSTTAPNRAAQPNSHTVARFQGAEQNTPVYHRDELAPGHMLSGPAIVVQSNSNVVVDLHWQAEVLTGGELLLSYQAPSTGQAAGEQASDELEATPVTLELFNNHFASVAEQMGVALRNTAGSVNVKERLDFSCAVFTSDGDLVVNAPHIPVHLGAMGETVRRILADNPDIKPGDVFVTNDPYRGGSHLPDVTVVTPVFEESRLRFFTASRAHHAEIGGTAPGSMPPFSRSLAEEGVLIRNFKISDGGHWRGEALRSLLTSATYPSRNAEENLADISAQIAANRQGARDLLSMIEQHGRGRVTAFMKHIQRAAELKMRAALAALPDGRHEFADHLDDGSPIAVAITIDGETAEIDFTGTADVVGGNLNANCAIVTAAVMYCLRCLIAEDIPLNQGVLAPVKIALPPGLLNPPDRNDPQLCAAVAGGNVETSQRIVDVLFGALGVAAASQGTMNNLLFGDESFGYYETICGGAGATPEADGADAVHTHMTNTRLTDPEVLESRYPVRIRRFAIRTDSGGAGLHRGGHGVVRELEFLRPLTLSLLTQRRGPYAPYGLDGGEPGALGKNTLIRADGETESLAAIGEYRVETRDVLRIETPGGGGFGRSR